MKHIRNCTLVFAVTISLLASCLECFDRTENIVESCKKFSNMVNCELNTSAKECEETKVSLTKYCSSQNCQGDFSLFLICLPDPQPILHFKLLHTKTLLTLSITNLIILLG